MHTTHAPTNIRLSPSTGQWLLGANNRTRLMVRHMLLSYALLWLVHGLRAWVLLSSNLPLDNLWWSMGFDLLWMTSCWAVVRSDAGARWRDPAMTSWQVGFALLSLLMSFVLVDAGRSAAFPLMVVILAMGLYQLSQRQVLRLGGVAAVLMALCLWVLNLTSAPGIHSNREALSLLAAVLVLPWLGKVAQRIDQHRVAYGEQKRVLTRTLTRLGELKTHDALTGLTDHHHMEALLTAECKRHARNGLTFSLALFSIEQLQQINTRYGSIQGDAVIRQLGQLAAQHLRSSDVVARWSHHEFLILMPETDLHGAHRSVERLREFLSTRWGFYSEGRWIPMDCAVGVTHFRVADTMVALMQRVENALNDARRMAQTTTVKGDA